MNKKVLFPAIITLIVLAVIIILLGYTQTKTCGDNICNTGENNSLSEVYCPIDCTDGNLSYFDENETAREGTRRFALDGEMGFVETLYNAVLLKDGLSELQGNGIVKWGIIQPEPPVNGVANYNDLNDPKAAKYKQFLVEFEKTNRELSAVIEFSNNDWALDFHPNKTVQSPITGKQIPGFVRIKPEYEEAWKDFIKYYLALLPSLKYIQIDNEPENTWVSGEGYVRSLELAYQAVQEYNLEHKTNVKVLVAGFYIGNSFNKVPKSVQIHSYENYPNINETWIKQEMNLSMDTPSEQIQLVSQKIHVTLSVLMQKNPSFDILTLHFDSPADNFNDVSSVVESHKKIMQETGYSKEIWLDDMHSGYYTDPKAEQGTIDYKIHEGLSSRDQTIIKQYVKVQPTWLTRKTVNNFAAGFERVKIAQVLDMPAFFMPVWRYVGLFTEDYKPKPAYYTAKTIIEQLDYFKTATKVDLNEEDYLYKFTFEDKGEVYVAWTEPLNESGWYWNDKTIKTIDLNDYIESENVEITYLVNEVDRKNKPITKPNKIVLTSQIPISSEPIFIELEPNK